MYIVVLHTVFDLFNHLTPTIVIWVQL